MILLTGTPGWLANRFVELLLTDRRLKTEEPIRCLCLPHADVSCLQSLPGHVKIVYGDVSDKASLEQFFKEAAGSTLFHLAGIIHPSFSVKDFFRVNVVGTANVLDLARENGVRKTIVMSSNSQSGCNPDNEHLFTEDSPYNPYMNYGKSKMQMERLALKYMDRYDMDITILRTCWFYGPHQPARQTEFFSMIKAGKFPLLGDGSNIRSMSYVDNTCQGMLLAAQKPISKGKIYWLADERSYPMKEIIDTVEEVLELDFGFSVAHKRLMLPSRLGDIAGIVDWALQGIGFYNKKIHVLSEMNKNIACSIERAKRELGYAPMVSLRHGMQKSIEWCLEHNQTI